MNQRKSSGWAPDGNDAAADEPLMEDSPGVASDTYGEPSIFGLLQRIVEDGRAYAETEAERQKLRARILGAAGRDTALLVLSALVLLGGALTSLLIGCVLILAPLVGVLAALALTILAAFMLVFLLLLAAKARVRRAMRIAFRKDEDT